MNQIAKLQALRQLDQALESGQPDDSYIRVHQCDDGDLYVEIDGADLRSVVGLDSLLTRLPNPHNFIFRRCKFGTDFSWEFLSSMEHLQELTIALSDVSSIPALPPNLIRLVLRGNPLAELGCPPNLLSLDIKDTLIRYIHNMPDTLVHIYTGDRLEQCENDSWTRCTEILSSSNTETYYERVRKFRVPSLGATRF